MATASLVRLTVVVSVRFLAQREQKHIESHVDVALNVILNRAYTVFAQTKSVAVIYVQDYLYKVLTTAVGGAFCMRPTEWIGRV